MPRVHNGAMWKALGLAVSIGVLGCGGDDDSVGGSADAGTDAGGTADSGIVDSAAGDGGGGTDICDELGLSRRPMREGTGHAYGDVAGDFTVETLDGPFTLSEAWTGCESYVFINFVDADVGRGLFASFPDPLLRESARNVHYFFTSYEADADAVRARVESLRDSFEEAFALLDPPDAEHWRPRVHFVTEPLTAIEGSIGELARGQTLVQLAFAIDREQRFDPVGSLMRLTGSGWVPRLEMAAYAGHYYDYRAELAERLSSESDATVVPLVSETDFAERVFDREAVLPDAATMAGFDTLEVDVEVFCRRDPADCSEWDRIAKIELCGDATCSELRELVRWITPYARPGSRRWLMDASPLLGLLRAGGTRTFRITMGPTWEDATERDVAISLRLRDAGSGERALGAELAFRGGAFDAGYNAAHEPYRFTPPAGTGRVKLVVLLSGHGQTEGDNCAEWCNHEHAFTVSGGTPRRIDFPSGIGEPFGCAALARRGVVPGQYGNWAPMRAGWCPGLPVSAVRFDVTDDVTLGAENELGYVASFDGAEPRGGDIDLSAYVVFYE